MTSPNEGLPKNQILLSFHDEGTAEYVRLVCRRKGTTLEDYILGNFEWDDQPMCFSDLNEGEKITAAVCDGCEYISTCPDAVKPRGRS